jgi:hypothetical protein
MPEVVLKITGDNSSAVQALSQVGEKQEEVSKTAKKSSDAQKKGAKDVVDANKAVNNSIKDMNKSILDTATNILSIGLAVSAVKSLATSVINTRAEFQKFEAVLTNTLGSNSLAQTALKNIQTFAAQTPFGVKELTESFVKLANTGFKPTTDELRKLGDLAASQGKSFNMLTEAIIDAQTGEFERLKEFGIRASKAGDQVTLSFKDQKVQVDNNNESIRNAILAFGDLEGVAGGMAAISETLGGKISNLNDNFDAFFNNLGENTEGVFGGVIDGMNELLGSINQAGSLLNEARRNLKAEGVQLSFFDNITGKALGASAALQEIVDSTKASAEETKNYADAQGLIDEQTYIATSAIARNGVKGLTEQISAYTEELTKGTTAKKVDTKAIQEQIKANKDLLKLIEDLDKKAKDAENERLTGSEKIQADLQAELDAVKEREDKLIEAGIKARGQGFKLDQEQLDDLATLREEAQRKADEKLKKLRTDFEEKAQKELADLQKEGNDLLEEMVDKNQKTLEDENKARILLTKEGSEERLNAEIESINTERDFILANYQLTAEQRIIIEQEALDKIEKLRDDFIKKQPSKLDSWLMKTLGVTEEELGKIKSALDKASGLLKDFALNQLSEQIKLRDEQIKINQEIVSEQEDKIKNLEAQLEEELQLQKDGLANNVDAIRQQIADEQNAKNAALENEKRIQEERKKLALAQLALDSATQVSDLITASTEIFKSLAFLGPIGVGIAVATIGLMIGSFISAKAKAVQAINQGFKEGGYTGNDAVDEVVGSVHGQEFVSTAKTTKKHRPLLEAMHKEDYSRLTIKDLMPILEGTGVTFNKDVLMEIQSDQSSYNQKKSEEPVKLLRAMEATNKNIGKFFQHYKNAPKPPIQHSDGSMEYQIGNTKRRVRKK